jgi:hypothetical protein
MKRRLAVFVVLNALGLTGCSGSPVGGSINRDNNQNIADQPLAGVAAVTHEFGELIPANPDMVRLMKLPITSRDGVYSARLIMMNPKRDDMRAIYVGDQDADNIILGHVDQTRGSFERYSYLTSPRGELRCVVYTSSGSTEQRIVARNDSGYQKAARDFADQVLFWTNAEGELKERFRGKESRQ